MKKSLIQLRVGVAILASLLVVACESVQTTQGGAVGVTRSQQMSPLVSEADLQRASAQAYKEALGKATQQHKLNTNAAVVARVRTISNRLIAQTPVFRPDARNWAWEVNVIDSAEVNAWCMPGGKIAVYTGLIDKLQTTDAELAAVVGHEIAHALREHARERASRQVGSSAVAGIIGAATGNQGFADLTSLATDLTLNLPNSRLHETEADQMGVELAARAGYDPRAAISLWEKMGRVAGGSGMPQFLSTHPSSETRLRDLQNISQRVQPVYEAALRTR